MLRLASLTLARPVGESNHRAPPLGGFFAAKTQLSQAEVQRLYEQSAKLRPEIWEAQRTVEEAREVKFRAECAGLLDIVDDINMRLGILEARNFPIR